ncbi:ArsR/SmtB family transcription factor [Dinghuibacter silviterrae]|uniref:ArsR family transcriptional regulator n=1 Tax=Dinghuibacter silviterrae TaxID=1539049 RepID=A0A4R8DNT2_9BACT|nr:metalloregulator ArsR/SmtB family transcription factor [Dinghuibacter silviterrae]TDW99375.1 ArsR family transcriptional regulator [Dinghuibacter silviterrae]
MTLKDVEKISKALGDPHRLKMLQEVSKRGVMSCTDVCDLMNLAQSSVSHHAKQLVDSGIVIAEKEGRHVKYAIDKKVLNEYMKFLKCFGG